ATYFLGNPGYGAANDFPKPKRDYDAVTLYLTKVFADDWLAQASYTISYLRGNYAGLFRPETAQLDPNINSDFDLRSLLANRTGPLPGDQRHSIKLFGARDFDLDEDRHIQLGGSVRAHSGGPTNYFGSHPLYGANEVFILPRGAGDRLPWVYDVDMHLAYNFKFSKVQDFTISFDVFNIFNFQSAVAVDQRYTSSDVRPIQDGGRGDLPKLTRANGAPFSATEINPNFGKPTAYQPPRYFRIG